MKNTLLKEAITDAKSIREAALANAKKALEETLTPKLQEMLDAKLDEDLDPELNEVEDLDENINLDAILAELDEEDTLQEAAKDDDKEDKDDKKDKDEDKKDDAPKAAKKDPEGDLNLPAEEDETELVADLSVEDLKSIIGDIVAAEFGGDDDGLEPDGLENAPIDGDGLTSDLGDDENPDADPFGADEDEPLNLEELLSELDGLEESELQAELAETKEELAEAMKVVADLRKTLNEVNLTNSKLLYLNKIFKAKNLNESQKTKVVSTFDKAESIKEAKLIYESLLNNLTTNAKPITEARVASSASRIIGAAPKAAAVIVEVNENISRMQKLAGIIK